MTVANSKNRELNTVAIIPAREGSKGLTCKNIRPLLGKPLIAWTIEQALNCRGISDVIVSTDSHDIAAVAESYGASIPFIRPKALAGDTSLIGHVVTHAKELLMEQGTKVDILLTMLPSHPFRSQQLLNTAVEALKKDSCHSFKTALREHVPPGSMVSIQRGRLVPTHSTNRGLPETFVKPIGLLSGQKLDCAYGREYIYTVNDPRETLDIDTEQDFAHAEQVLGGAIHA